MNKISLKLFLLLFLCSLIVVLLRINIVKAASTIYIRADGNVEGTDRIQKDGDFYTLISDISSSIVVEKNNIVLNGASHRLRGDGNQNGITLSDINNNTIKNLRLSNFNIGIVVMGSHNNTILDNIITDNFRGLDFTSSQNNTISGNYIANNTDGIAMEAIDNSIVKNTITNNIDTGIFLYAAGFNNVIENNITDNNRGIMISICHNNMIYQNNFINNTNHIKTDNSIVIWDNDKKGNYWDNYTGTDNNADGIGDTVYIISENNQDNYPLINIIPEFPSWTAMLIMLVAVASVTTVYKLKLHNREKNG